MITRDKRITNKSFGTYKEYINIYVYKIYKIYLQYIYKKYLLFNCSRINKYCWMNFIIQTL